MNVSVSESKISILDLYVERFTKQILQINSCVRIWRFPVLLSLDFLSEDKRNVRFSR